MAKNIVILPNVLHLRPFVLGIDKGAKLWYSCGVKSNDEDTCFRSGFPERDPLGERVLYSGGSNTTSELSVGNGRSGAPVTVPMSDGIAVTRVEPWNTFVSHP